MAERLEEAPSNHSEQHSTYPHCPRCKRDYRYSDERALTLSCGHTIGTDCLSKLPLPRKCVCGDLIKVDISTLDVRERPILLDNIPSETSSYSLLDSQASILSWDPRLKLGANPFRRLQEIQSINAQSTIVQPYQFQGARTVCNVREDCGSQLSRPQTIQTRYYYCIEDLIVYRAQPHYRQMKDLLLTEDQSASNHGKIGYVFNEGPLLHLDVWYNKRNGTVELWDDAVGRFRQL